jgi:membrane-associated phospholipid phosphatase
VSEKLSIAVVIPCYRVKNSIIELIGSIPSDVSHIIVIDDRCPDGTGKFFTPPFPAYPSGHAAFGAAAVEVMVDFVGDNYYLVDRCHENRGEFDGRPRAFNSFYAMAEENAYSRIPLGVHVQADLDAGLALGYQIGRKVNQLPWRR